MKDLEKKAIQQTWKVNKIQKVKRETGKQL